MSARVRRGASLVRRGAALALAAALPGCGADAPAPPAAGEPWPTDPTPVAGSACGAVVQRHPREPADHVAECSPLAFSTDPPSSGPHYGRWPAFGAYDDAVPWGFLVHALEHGAVVFTWRCPEGCAEDVAAAEAAFAALPADPLCAQQGRLTRRALLTPSVALGHRWAASAWGATLVSDCFEPGVFRDFYVEYVGGGPERVCAEGSELRAEGGAGLALPPGCGE